LLLLNPQNTPVKAVASGTSANYTYEFFFSHTFLILQNGLNLQWWRAFRTGWIRAGAILPRVKKEEHNAHTFCLFASRANDAVSAHLD